MSTGRWADGTFIITHKMRFSALAFLPANTLAGFIPEKRKLIYLELSVSDAPNARLSHPSLGETDSDSLSPENVFRFIQFGLQALNGSS
jgi:hypothetical protein